MGSHSWTFRHFEAKPEIVPATGFVGIPMDKSERSPIGSQFSIKRLFWTMIVASVVFKLADLFGFLNLISMTWEAARGNQLVLVIISIIAFTVIAIIYIAWLGIRLPHLIEQYVVIQKKRNQRRDEYRKVAEGNREQRSE